MNKKGVINQLQPIVTALIGIAIVLVVGFLIFAEAKEQVIEITSVSTTHLNETVSSWTNNTAQHLSFDSNCMDGTFSCGPVYNGSSGGGAGGAGAELPATAYNCNTSGIAILNNSGLNGTITATLNVTYSCSNKTIAYNATGTIQNATQDIPGWLPIIVITLIGAILLGLVTRFRRG